MDKVVGTAIVIAVLVLIFAALLIGWRARRRKQSGLPTPGAPPADRGPVRLSADVLYVATTRADSPLDRITVRGLGFRARAAIEVTPAGVVLEIAGQPSAFVPAADLRGVGRATWTIDRVVNRDGLVFARWSLGGTEVDSYLRTDDPDALVAAIEPLLLVSVRTPAPASAPASAQEARP